MSAMASQGFDWDGAILTTAFTAVVDIGLFAWMHFTPDGLLFGAGVAEWMGMIDGSVAEVASSSVTDFSMDAVGSSATDVCTFNDAGLLDCN